MLIATIALALVFQELMLYTFGGHFLGIPSTLEGSVRFLGVSIPYQRLLILVVAARHARRWSGSSFTARDSASPFAPRRMTWRSRT